MRLRFPIWILGVVLASACVAAPVPKDLSRLARDFVASGDTEKRAALAAYARKTSQPNKAYALLALGYGDFHAESYAAAAQALEIPAEHAALVADYAVYYRGKSFAQAERHDDAAWVLRDFAKRHPSSRLSAAADRLRIESLIEGGHLKQAAALLQPKASHVPEPVRLYLLGRVHEASGRSQTAIDAYRRAYYFHPVSPEADLAEEQLNGIRKRLGAKYPSAPAAWRFERGNRLFAAGRNADAADQYRWALPGLSGADKQVVQVRLGAAEYKRLHTSVAYQLLGKVAVDDPQLEAERIYYLGQCERRKGLIARFRGRAEELAKRFPKSPWYEETLFTLGNYYLLKNKPAEYRRYYDRAAREFPQGKHSANAHWKVSWRAYLDRDPRSQALLEEHLKLYPRSPQASAALYWLGRLREKAGAAPEARAIYSEIDARYPHHYYAYQALTRLAELGRRPAALPAELSAMTAKLSSARRLESNAHARMTALIEKGRLLFDLGLDQAAERELQRADYRRPDAHLIGLELSRQSAARHEYGRGLRHMKRYGYGYLRIPFEAMPLEFWKALYPLPWEAQLRRRAKPHGLDPYLVAGLIRQESEYDHRAVSRAGARGLMQVMPATGKELFQRLGIPRFSRAKLHDPDISLRLGAFHLKQGLAQFDDPEVALAAYNAGPHRAETWITWADFAEPAEFVETIPFSETRGYVQSVLRNREMYKRIYDQGAPSRTSTRAAAGR